MTDPIDPVEAALREARSYIVDSAIGIDPMRGVVVRRIEAALRASDTPDPRPTGAELAAMSDADFGSFVRASGIKTVSDTDPSGHSPWRDMTPEQWDRARTDPSGLGDVEAAWNAMTGHVAMTTPYLLAHWRDLIDEHRPIIEAAIQESRAGGGLAVAVAARLEGEVSRLRTELAACSEADVALDEERLTRAFTVVQPGLYGQDWPRDDPDDFQFVNPSEHARAIAAAYAKDTAP